MSSSKASMATDKSPTDKTPPEINAELRNLAHDLSNSIETIMQATYLLSQAEMDENGKKWLELIDKASRDAARINRDIREHLRAQTAQIASGSK
jgi:light-regulated signal transduction histidine kinase (bacteriophytochrome)